MRSKIHKARVTEVNINYEGSIGIDRALAQKAGLMPGEKVLVVDNTNGARLETYVMEEEENSGKVIIYGAAGHLIKRGDEIIVMGFELASEPPNVKKIIVDQRNKPAKEI